MKKTKIEWCDSTWNPVTGCYHGCEYCYARRIACRFGDFSTIDGNAIKIINPHTNTPCYEVKHKAKNPYPGKFTPTFHMYRLDEPASWTQPRNIFVCSMADLFGEWVPDEWISEVFAACERAPQHRYLFLTKNPSRYDDLDAKDLLPHKENMWYGISVTNAEEASRALTTIEDMPNGAGAFLSLEPLTQEALTPELDTALADFTDWVIVGAETGNRKGKVVPSKDWVNKIKRDCALFEKALFMKDSLVPIVGEEGMQREFPWDKKEGVGNG